MKTWMGLIVLSFLVVRHGAAHAEPDTWFPSGVTMDRWGTESLAGSLELGWVRLDARGFGEEDPSYGLHADFYAQAVGQVVSRVRAGAYASFPYGYLSDGKPGNPAVGGIVAIAVARGTVILLHGGRTFRTADLYDLGSILKRTGTGRITDRHLHTPGAAWLRLGSSALHRSGRFFGRLDFGLDVYLDVNDGALDNYWRGNVAAGWELDRVVLLAELATVITVLGNGGDRTDSTLALTAHMPHDTASPYLGLVAPVDSLRRELDFALVAGARFALPE